MYTEHATFPRQDKAKGSPSKGQHHNQKGHDNRKGSRNSSPSKGNKGKLNNSTYEPSYYGNRTSRDKRPTSTEGAAHNKGSRNNSKKGKSKGKPRTLTSRNSGPWCTFCKRLGHTRANCFKVQKLQRTKPYKNILLELEDDQHELLHTAIDSHGSDYCGVCHDPECPVDRNCLDPMSECVNGPSEAQIAIQNILYMEEHEPLIQEIEKLKPVIDSNDRGGDVNQEWASADIHWQHTDSLGRVPADDSNDSQYSRSEWGQQNPKWDTNHHSNHEQHGYYE